MPPIEQSSAILDQMQSFLLKTAGEPIFYSPFHSCILGGELAMVHILLNFEQYLDDDLKRMITNNITLFNKVNHIKEQMVV